MYWSKPTRAVQSIQEALWGLNHNASCFLPWNMADIPVLPPIYSVEHRRSLRGSWRVRPGTPQAPLV